MNAVTLTSSFPATVQPGIPNLGETPTGWIKAPLGQFLREVRRPIKMEDDETYKLVTVKRARGGVVDRGSFLGRDVLVKSQFKIEAGDFLISKRQIVHGACGLVPNHLAGSIVSNEYAVLNGNDAIDTTFLNYLAHSVFFQQTCFHSSIGVHVEKMIFKLDRWLKFDFNLPPLPEQRKIADILSTWDAAIEKTEALLATAKAQKRALMQSLLTGRRRFPKFEGQPWKEVRLGDVVDLITKGTTPTSVGFAFTDCGVNFVKAENVNDNGNILPAKAFISDECHEALRRSRFEAGDLLVTIAGAIGRIGIVREENLPANTNQAVAIVRTPNHGVIARRMLFYWLQGDYIQSIFRTSVTTGAQPNISLKQLGNLPLRFPSIQEQNCIVSILDDAGSEVDALVTSITKLRTEKKALMQQLLTGKRRVVV